MEKKKLLKRLQQCAARMESKPSRMDDDYGEFEAKRQLFKEKYEAIEMALLLCNYDLPELSSLQDFDVKDGLYKFIRQNDYATVKSRLESMITEFRTWARYNESNAPAMKAGHGYHVKLRRGRHIGRMVGIILFALFTLGAAVCGILELLDVLHTGGIIAVVCGICDFINGSFFGIREIITDNKENKMLEDMAAITGVPCYKTTINVCGCGNSVNMGTKDIDRLTNGREWSREELEELIEEFISKYDK